MTGIDYPLVVAGGIPTVKANNDDAADGDDVDDGDHL